MNHPKNYLKTSGLLAHDPTILRTIIIVSAILQTLAIGMTWSGLRQQPLLYIFLVLLYLSTFVSYLLYHFRLFTVGALFYVSSAWLSIAVGALLSFSDSELSLGYLSVILILAFMLLGRRWGIIVALLSTLLLTYIVALRYENLLTVTPHLDGYAMTTLYNEMTISWLVTVMLFILMGNLQRANAESAEAAQALRNKTELLELITSNVPAHITYFDTDERYIFANQHFYNMVCQGNDPVGKRRVDVLPEATYLISRPHVDRALQGESVQFDYQISAHGKPERISEIQLTPLFVGGKLQGVIALATDVTRMRRTESALFEAQRAESLGVVAGGIAHDFNNLLSAMLGQASLARWKLGRDHPARKHIEKNIDAAERASQLTKQMLAYSGRGNFEKTVFDFNKLLKDNADLLQVSIPKQVMLHIQLADTDALHIKADIAQMQQVVMNLILNGAQAMPNGSGNIWAETRLVNLSGEQCFGTRHLPAGQYVCCAVRDDGSGMSDEVKRRIFDPFFTTKENGSGLGLAAVSGIIHGHGGGLRVNSELGVGTSFEFLLPLVKCSNSISQVDTPAEQLVTSGTVLLVDDERIIADAVEDILSLYDVELLYANRGESGIHCYQANRANINVVLLDLTMPGMSGTKVFHKLRSLDPTLPIIISSGYSRDVEAQKIIDAGSADFLPKPYNISDLINALGRYLP